MSRESLLAAMRQSRRDWSEMLFHFTRAKNGKQPFDILLDILEEGVLRGGDGYIRGGYNCVCFTESPITELASVFALNRHSDESLRPRYSLYGVAVQKTWLYERGGRPAIYQKDTEYDDLPDSMKYRHVSYDPNNGVDFTWEREWRYHGDALELDARRTIVVVKNAAEASLVMGHYKGQEYTMTREVTFPGVGDATGFEAKKQSTHHLPHWMTVSLDLFGFSLLQPEH